MEMISSNGKPRILVVDDEPKIVHLIREVLTAAGYEVLAAFSGELAIEMVAREQPDLVLLDIILPGKIDGYQVAQRLREFSDLPIIMLTAKTSETDLLHGFDVGVDDYITKPFSSKELIVRIRAVLKRCQERKTIQTRSEIVCRDLHIDLARRRVTIGGREIYLTHTEYSLLYELASHCDQVLLHEQLLTAVWGSEYRDDVNYLRSYIHILRKKLEVDPTNPKLILSNMGVGYMLVTSDVAQPDKLEKDQK
jgi:two-component system KDP operon response regulator KdpE